MFCDLVGSTALAAHLDPEELRELIRPLSPLAAEAARRFDGLVAKYMGDAVLVYFGYPRGPTPALFSSRRSPCPISRGEKGRAREAEA